MFLIYPLHSFLSLLMGSPGITSDQLSGCRCRGGAGCCDVITLLGVDLCMVMVEAGVIRVSGPPTALHTVRQMLFINQTMPKTNLKGWSSSIFLVNRYTADFFTNKTEVSE